MLGNIGDVEVLVYKKVCDMRKSIQGLSQLVIDDLSMNPTDGRVYVFCNKGRDKLKILYWDRNGFCLWYKILEKEKFKMPKVRDSVLAITGVQLRWLLDGLPIKQRSGFKKLKYQIFG